ncbi:MAG: D-tyrosyl-tRNA(Tyr) deacylase [Gammaproteobacteria bacterium]|nr:MAG: D-tyrosyl-tRNA(Tyr) deacylase [Gammaproteobacteria bacterium]
MIGLLQRVQSAGVEIAGKSIANIGHGLLVLVGIQQGDTGKEASRLLERLLGYRVFPDSAGKMNLSIRDVSGELLLVPQFTLAADTHTGMRPGFSTAADPADGERLFARLVSLAGQQYERVASGQFGADMQVTLVNDGPVTFWLEVSPGPVSVQR